MNKIKDNPLDSRNPFTLSYFHWCGKYIKKANEDNLKLNDMPLLSREYRFENYTNKMNHFSQETKEKNEKPTKYHIVKIILKTFKWEIIFFLFILLVLNLNQYMSSFMLQQILRVRETYQQEEQFQYYLIYMSLYLTVPLLQQFLQSYVDFQMSLLGRKSFYGLSNLCIEKSLKISFSQNTGNDVGKIINLGTVDSNQFQNFANMMAYLVSAPISIIMGLTYMYILVGPSLLFGLATLIIFTIINICVAKRRIKYQKEYLKLSGLRIKKLEETYNNIEYVKSNNAENFFYNKINKIREQELSQILKYNINSVFVFSNIYITSTLVLLSVFIGYLLLGNQLTVSVLFTFISVYDTVNGSFTFLPTLFTRTIDIAVSSKRIADFLYEPEIQKPVNQYKQNNQYDIEIKNGVFYYQNQTNNEKDTDDTQKNQDIKINEKIEEPLLDKEQNEVNKKNIVANINSIQIEKGQLVALIGKIGCGKSSLLLSIMGELRYEEQDDFYYSVHEDIGYVSDKPWIANQTIRENIIMGKEFNEQQYKDVLYHSCLLDDLALFKDKDMTILGNKGVNLSGGQKVRVSLARVLYQNNQILLFDDPLSALDINVSSFIFKKTIQKFLKGKTIVIATHNLNYLKNFDKVLFMDESKITFQGTYEELKQYDQYQVLQDIMKKTELTMNEEKQQKDKELKTKKSIEKKKKSFTHQTNDEQIPEEKSGEDIVKHNKEIKKKNLFNEILSQQHEDYDIDEKNVQKELEERTTVSIQTYKNYIKHGKFILGLGVVISVICYGFAEGFSYYFYNQQGNKPAASFDINTFITYFLIISVARMVFAFLRLLLCYIFGYDVSIVIHNLSLFRILHTSINEFFYKNPVGKTLNRLSGDIQNIDRFIPILMASQLNNINSLLVNLILALLFTNWILAVFFVVSMFIMMRHRNNFSVANVLVTKQESVTKSPYYSVFTDFISGNMIIRTQNKSEYYRKKTIKIAERNFRTQVLNVGISKWYQIRLQIFSYLFIIPVFGYVLFLDESKQTYLAIIVLSSTKLLDYIRRFLNFYTYLENSMVAFDRIYNYSQLEGEQGLNSVDQEIKEIYQKKMQLTKYNIADRYPELSKWISEGHIVFKNVSAQYSEQGEKILKGIDLNILPGEKIGIIGRTGAGKSSLVKLLLRFLEHVEGEILIDDVNIYNIDVRLLRQQIVNISQDSVFFEGTLKENLDVFQQSTDEEIWNMLDEAKIKTQIELKGGLDMQIETKGQNLSLGEKQLFCFIRAVLLKGKIVIMDEATSNVDIKTEETIEFIKNKYFKNVTTLSIAHRLNTIYDSDRILILDQGKVKAFNKYQNFNDDEKIFFKNYLEDLQKGIID